MEQNLPKITKKVWKLMRVMFFMLKKGISKTKVLADLNMMMTRGKIAGKDSHHHHANHLFFPAPPPGEYEFSCSTTPPYPLSLFSSHKKHKNKRRRTLATSNPPLAVDDCDDIIINSSVLKALDHMMANVDQSPMVEQLKIMDSPFPVTHGGEDGRVDEAAENFIRRFYNNRISEN